MEQAKGGRGYTENFEGALCLIRPTSWTRACQRSGAGCRPLFKGTDYPRPSRVVEEQVVTDPPYGIEVGPHWLGPGAIVGGFYGDSAVTVAVGQADDRSAQLVRVTEESLYLGINQAVVGNRLSDISHAIQAHVEGAGYSVVTEFVGHGIGRQLHEEPQVPNYWKQGRATAAVWEGSGYQRW